jgi:hypothetical protein
MVIGHHPACRSTFNLLNGKPAIHASTSASIQKTLPPASRDLGKAFFCIAAQMPGYEIGTLSRSWRFESSLAGGGSAAAAASALAKSSWAAVTLEMVESVRLRADRADRVAVMARKILTTGEPLSSRPQPISENRFPK